MSDLTNIEFNTECMEGNLIHELIEYLRNSRDYTYPVLKFMYYSKNNLEGFNGLEKYFIEDAY